MSWVQFPQNAYFQVALYYCTDMSALFTYMQYAHIKLYLYYIANLNCLHVYFLAKCNYIITQLFLYISMPNFICIHTEYRNMVMYTVLYSIYKLVSSQNYIITQL